MTAGVNTAERYKSNTSLATQLDEATFFKECYYYWSNLSEKLADQMGEENQNGKTKQMKTSSSEEITSSSDRFNVEGKRKRRPPGEWWLSHTTLVSKELADGQAKHLKTPMSNKNTSSSFNRSVERKRKAVGAENVVRRTSASKDLANRKTKQMKISTSNEKPSSPGRSVVGKRKRRPPAEWWKVGRAQ